MGPNPSSYLLIYVYRRWNEASKFNATKFVDG